MTTTDYTGELLPGLARKKNKKNIENIVVTEVKTTGVVFVRLCV